ncbi:MAG: ABC transporter ATP-binding protein [Candidatus Izemoplasmatales bacterium]|nr:ABC transporter ATP-binding protein [Candidatus Izemoplasmatales bacterium]
MKVLETKKLNKYFEQGNNKNHILKNISLTINSGDFLGIIGPSGSGKTTLLYCLGTLENFEGGDVFLLGRNIKDLNDKEVAKIRNSEIGYVFQFFNLIPNLTAYENVLLASAITKQVNDERIDELLMLVGMEKFKEYYPEQLSGGMQQRIAIARALINGPKILFADEPTGNLDQKKGKEIMELLKKLNKEQGLTIILVTHNEDYISYCNRTINLIDGEIV